MGVVMAQVQVSEKRGEDHKYDYKNQEPHQKDF